MITDEQLQEWQAVTDAATPEPWEEVAENGAWWMATVSDEINAPYIIADTTEMAGGDAAFIIAARVAMPALLAEAAKARRGHARYCAAVTMYDEPLTFDAWLDMLAGE